MDKNQFKKGNDDPVSEDKEFNSFFLKYCNDFLTKPQRLYRIHMKNRNPGRTRYFLKVDRILIKFLIPF